MQTRKVLSCVCCTLLIVSAIAAPVSEKHAKDTKDKADVKRNADTVEDQEKELESLVALAEKPAKSNMQNVDVHKSHAVHVETVNGKEVKSEHIEEKVIDTVTGKVLSDIEQEVDSGNDASGKPEMVVETKVDIPDKDIHKTFYTNRDDAEPGWQVQDSLHGIEFTPTAIAEYLMKTWDFENFYKALDELVDSAIMTNEEAAKYEQDVIREYQRITNDYSNIMGEFPRFANDGFDMEDEGDVKKRTMTYPDDLYSEYYGEGQGEDQLDLGEVRPDTEGNPETVESALDELLEDWWVQAFEAGDPRARSLVKYLYDVVAQDNNPDDMGQIKELLAEMLANALLEDLSTQGTADLPAAEMEDKVTDEKRSRVEPSLPGEEDASSEEATPVDDEAEPSVEETAAEESKEEEKEKSEEDETVKSEEKSEEKREETQETSETQDEQVQM